MTSRPMRRAGGVPGRQMSFVLSCTASSVGGNGIPRSWSASSITRRPGMLLPHESHHLPAAVIKAARPVLPDMDRDYALLEWREAEEPAIFDPGWQLGTWDRAGWEETIAWRREVSGLHEPPTPQRLCEALQVPS